MPKPRPLVALFACAFLLAGCDRVAQAVSAVANPGAAFDQRCAELPASEVVVTVTDAEVRERRDLPQAALEAKHRERGQHTVGLTEARFEQKLDIRYSGLQDNRGRACVRPQVAVELSLSPLDVFVASEYASDPCREPVIRAHEQKHVDAYVGFVAEAAPQLRQQLEDAVGREPFRGTTPEEAQRGVQQRLEKALAGFVRTSERELAERNGAVDSPEEYASLSRACGPTP